MGGKLSQAEKIEMGYKCVVASRKFKAVIEPGAIMVYDQSRGVYTNGGREIIGTILQRELRFKIGLPPKKESSCNVRLELKIKGVNHGQEIAFSGDDNQQVTRS